MGKWTAEVTLDPIQFDGDTITITAKRLLAADISIIFEKYDAETGKLRFANNAELAKVTADIFPKYITSISGMTKGDGTPFTVAEFVEASKEAYFIPLIAELFSALMQISTVKAEEKNSDLPQAS